MEIRKMTEKDVVRAASLEAEIFSDAWSQKGFYDSLKNPDAIMLAAEENEEIAGYCCMYTALDEAEIVNVAVSPKYRRRGVATQMLSVLFEQFVPQGVSCVYLEVRAHNEAAKCLYESFGFRGIGVRKNFYEKPAEDAIVMQMIRKTGDDCQ